jgi:hypothetical protein
MSEGGQRSEPPKTGWARLLEAGPVWITAISRLTVALAAAGFLGGYVTGSNGSAAPQPTITVTQTALRGSSGSSGSPGDKPTAASGGKTYLTQLSPLQAGAFGVTDGPVQIGSDTYRNSISFACGEGAAETQSVVYDVAGFHYLNATVGIPNDSPDTTGTAANVIFHKTGTSTPIGPPISSTPGNAQAVHINLHGAAQLTISCAGAGTTIALGDAALSSP